MAFPDDGPGMLYETVEYTITTSIGLLLIASFSSRASAMALPVSPEARIQGSAAHDTKGFIPDPGVYYLAVARERAHCSDILRWTGAKEAA